MWAAGEVAAAVLNTNRTDRKDRVWTAADFIPKPLREISQMDSEPEPEADPSLEGLAAFFGTRKEPELPRLVPEK